MKQFDINTPTKYTGWKFIKIKDRTHIIGVNGKKIKGFEASARAFQKEMGCANKKIILVPKGK